MIKSSRLIIIVLLLTFALFGMSRKLIFIQQIFRHGARYPITAEPFKYDLVEYVNEEQQSGELTSEGKHMHYILGKMIYQKYWKKLFGNTKYENTYHPTQIFVKSTNFNRTIQSAQSHLLGLFEALPPLKLQKKQENYSMPPNPDAELYLTNDNQTQFYIYPNALTFKPIPIHTERGQNALSDAKYKYLANPYDEGDFLVKYSISNCPNQDFWGKQNMVSEVALKIKKNAKVKSFLQKLSSSVKQTVKYEDAFHYIDSYECQSFMGKQYLDMFNDKQFLKTSNFIFLTSTILSFFHTKDQITASNTRLLQNIVRNMKLAINNKGPKIVIYSAHDTTVLSFNVALNFVSVACVWQYFANNANNSDVCITEYPTFASNIIIQLWEQDDLSHTIKIIYNGKQMNIPICGYLNSCPFLAFESWVNSFSIPNPNEVCGVRQQYTKLYIVIGILSFFIAVFVIIEMRTRLKKTIERKMMEKEERKGYLENFEEKDSNDHPPDHIHDQLKQIQADPHH